MTERSRRLMRFLSTGLCPCIILSAVRYVHSIRSVVTVLAYQYLQYFIDFMNFVDSQDTREEVRTWVLATVTESKIEQRLPSADKARGTLYEVLFESPRKFCVVTGYPVSPADCLEVNDTVGNRRDWNQLVAKTGVCPWTSQPQNPIY